MSLPAAWTDPSACPTDYVLARHQSQPFPMENHSTGTIGTLLFTVCSAFCIFWPVSIASIHIPVGYTCLAYRNGDCCRWCYTELHSITTCTEHYHALFWYNVSWFLWYTRLVLHSMGLQSLLESAGQMYVRTRSTAPVNEFWIFSEPP